MRIIPRFYHSINVVSDLMDSTLSNFLSMHRLDLNMYTGQVTALLGHNGAGKLIS